jgi:hypothetical protein
MSELRVSTRSFRIDNGWDDDPNALTVEWRGTGVWAVCNGSGHVLNHEMKWEREPLPSNRDAAFLERCRWVRSQEAIGAAEKAYSHEAKVPVLRD